MPGGADAAKADVPAAADAAKADTPAAAGKKGGAGSAATDVATLDDPVSADEAKLKADASALFGQAKVDVPVAAIRVAFPLGAGFGRPRRARHTLGQKEETDAVRCSTVPDHPAAGRDATTDRPGPEGRGSAPLNRMLLADTYPEQVPFQDGILCFSNRAASFLATLGFICFLTGRSQVRACCEKSRPTGSSDSTEYSMS